MGIFDSLKGAISGAGSTVAKKSREASETMRINSAIKSEEKKMKDAYYQIGMKYVELYGDKPEEGMAELVEIITAAKAAIEENEKKLELVKGNVTCPNCGAKIPEGSKFCLACGTSIVTEVPEEETEAEGTEAEKTVSEEAEAPASEEE